MPDSGLGKPSSLSPQALPSPSFGNSPPTFLLVATLFQPLVKLAITSSRPQNMWYVQSKPLAGSPLRPKNHGCHGTTLEMQGTWFSSQASLTGLAVSGVPAVSISATLSLRMRSLATSPARLGLLWLSFRITCTSYFLPPTLMPFLNAVFICSITHLSASPKGASGPVCGVT